MLDDLRQEADQHSFEDESDETTARNRLATEQFLGMTPLQRFVLAIMVLIITCLISSLFLLVSGKISPQVLF